MEDIGITGGTILAASEILCEHKSELEVFKLELDDIGGGEDTKVGVVTTGGGPEFMILPASEPLASLP
jgi:hypothetical protein